MGHTIHRYESLASTNATLRELLTEGRATHGEVVVAGRQTAGRGRRGRSWEAEAGSGLLVSVLLTPVEARVTYCLTSLAVRDAVSSMADGRASLKWPNDVLIGNRKVAGILVDLVTEGAIVGIGINTNMNRTELDRIGPEATSVAVETGRAFDHAQLLGRLIELLEEQYSRSRKSPDSVFREWRSALVTLGHSVEVETARERWVGQAVDVDEDGSLLVRHDERIERVYAADVRLTTV